MSILSRLQSFGRSALGIEIPKSPNPQIPAPMPAGQIMGRFGRWDSKVQDRLSGAHWAKASGLPINAELAYASNWLRAQSEYEISSNPVMEGLVRSFIADVVGEEGPTYRVTSADKAYNARREAVWNAWWEHAGANRQLSGVDILITYFWSLWKAGEFGTQMISIEEAEGPVKMRLLPVHMHRLLTPPEMLGDPDVALGVRRDKNRNPVEYYISQPYLFGPFEVYTGKFDQVRYEDFIHGYEITEEDQVRGVPWLATALDTMAEIRDWDKDMLEAAGNLAKTGIVWETDSQDGMPIQVQSGTTAPMQRGVHTFGPPGYKSKEIAPTQPSSDQQSFRKEKKAEIGRGRCIPAMLVNLDSSGHSYATARFDNQPYRRIVGQTRRWIVRIALRRMEEVVMREAELAGELESPPEGLRTGFVWPKLADVDPTKDSVAQRTYLQNGTLALSDAIIADGGDPDRVFTTRQHDAERLSAGGLPAVPGIPDPSKAAGAGAGTAGKGSQETGDRSQKAESDSAGSGGNAAAAGEKGRAAGDEDGHWVTIDGNHVLIKEDSSSESSAAEAKSEAAANSSRVAHEVGSKMHHEIAAASHREAYAAHNAAAAASEKEATAAKRRAVEHSAKMEAEFHATGKRAGYDQTYEHVKRYENPAAKAAEKVQEHQAKAHAHLLESFKHSDAAKHALPIPNPALSGWKEKNSALFPAKPGGEKGRAAGDEDGQWITVNGTHILIKDGQTADEAIAAHVEKHGNSGGPSKAATDPKRHNIALPKNPKRLNIDQAEQALAQMGYRRGESRYDPKQGMSYKLTDPSGKTEWVAAKEIQKKIYAGVQHPNQIGSAKRNPAERSLEDGGLHGRAAGDESATAVS